MKQCGRFDSKGAATWSGLSVTSESLASMINMSFIPLTWIPNASISDPTLLKCLALKGRKHQHIWQIFFKGSIVGICLPHFGWLSKPIILDRSPMLQSAHLARRYEASRCKVKCCRLVSPERGSLLAIFRGKTINKKSSPWGFGADPGISGTTFSLA